MSSTFFSKIANFVDANSCFVEIIFLSCLF